MTEDYERTSRAEDWPQEAQRLRADVPNVSRREDRLWLAIDGGTAVELQDCPYGEAGYRYLYERYDDVPAASMSCARRVTTTSPGRWL